MSEQPIAPAVPTADAITALRPLSLGAVRLDARGLLGAWHRRNADATLPHSIARLDEAGNVTNLHRVIGDAGDSPFAGYWFADSDIYKTLEAAAWNGSHASFADETAALLATAQDPDGYLNSYYQTDHRDRQWKELRFSHELYCAGHLIQAAVAAARTGTSPRLVEVARRFADLLVTRYGVDGEDAVCGHPEIETALVELYRVTGHRPYLTLATRFVDLRGHGLLGDDKLGPRYYQDHAPVRDADEATGHAVRQLYLLAGAVDVAVETGDVTLLAAAERLWDSALGTKTYVTGGQGSRHRDESFGDPYELPADRAYAETCAAIASFQLSWRLLLATGRARYADEMERLLYNGIACSTGADGVTFFYSNPLQLRTGHDGSNEDAPTQRLPWYSCACCPPNLARLLASLPAYAATGTAGGVELHLYGAGEVGVAGLKLRIATDYPWDGTVTIDVTAAPGGERTISLRIPSWCTSWALTVNGEAHGVPAKDGVVPVRKAWSAGDRLVLSLDMPPRVLQAHPRIDAVRGSAVLARGPVVYCLEHADHPGVVLEDLHLDAGAPIEVRRDGFAPATLVTTGSVRTPAGGDPYRAVFTPASEAAVALTAIPYFLWANRAPGPMRVWIPMAP
ncbi:glycoside hydrolase family 127 protein [Catenuloplanes japonicus]|uniref:glycoside hydrolase family 127 protein n=1 Tax=Catenuloplanes japonicus TaxID=33876 RepID=UPI000525B617|nr:beta-L-arabinofuranosidase domain-containing protein [Catenuloplanes japonicus]